MFLTSRQTCKGHQARVSDIGSNEDKRSGIDVEVSVT